MVSVRCRKRADEEGDEEEGGDGKGDGSENLCLNDQTDKAAQLEAAQLLQEFGSFGQVAVPLLLLLVLSLLQRLLLLQK